MLYLETPAGVGFSYSADDSYYGNVDDKMTGEPWSIDFSAVFCSFLTQILEDSVLRIPAILLLLHKSLRMDNKILLNLIVDRRKFVRVTLA